MRFEMGWREIGSRPQMVKMHNLGMILMSSNFIFPFKKKALYSLIQKGVFLWLEIDVTISVLFGWLFFFWQRLLYTLLFLSLSVTIPQS